MDQNKRLILFFLLMGLVWFGWFGVIQPRFFPVAAPIPAVDPEEEELLAEEDATGNAVENGADASGAEKGASAQEKGAAKESAWTLPKHPARPTLKIGSLDPASGYFVEATLNSQGAIVSSIALNDPRYRDLEDRAQPLKLVTHPDMETPATLQLAIEEFDDQLARYLTDSAHIDWKVEETIPDPEQAEILQGIVFSLRSPDGQLEARKSFRLRRVDQSVSTRVRDSRPEGYLLDVEFSFANLGDAPREVSYVLQGPVGMPLENQENTSKFRELEAGFWETDGNVSLATLTASEVTDQYNAAESSREANRRAAVADRRLRRLEQDLAALEAKEQIADKAAHDAELAKLRETVATQRERASQLTDRAREAGRGLERWDTPFQYLGVEVQYFASLLFPRDERPLAERYDHRRFLSGEPVVVEKSANENFNDISFELTSNPIALPPGKSVTHAWELYSGPKRTELLKPIGAEGVLDLGWFAWVSRGMLWILEHLHGIGLPYWLAIIGLTVIVRGAMFPISRKQAIGAAKMKELQPKLTELKEKYGKDQEKMLRAQMELFRKHGYGPLGPMASGCLPILLQLPIFIGLYQALQTSVDLRMERFLWIDNLAAPDATFQLPFPLPYLGSDFNILPLITIVLFYVQQKLFMPPATSPEQEAQYKMMNFMMFFMGFFFYHVPAGLCIYFIASSLWSIGERTLLSNTKAAHIGPEEAAEIEHELEELDRPKAKGSKPAVGGKGAKGGRDTALALEKSAPKLPGFLERLLRAAEDAKRDAELGGEKRAPRDQPPRDNPRKKSKSPRR